MAKKANQSKTSRVMKWLLKKLLTPNETNCLILKEASKRLNRVKVKMKMMMEKWLS